jgi:regulator of protease activity HflC (stomatin/prohibitin superfamily)
MSLQTNGERGGRITSILIGGAVVIGAAVVVLGSWYTVDEGQRGVILRNGAVVDTATPGLGFKLPVMDRVVRVSVQTGKIQLDDVATYSRDQQPATMRVSVNYRLLPDQVASIYAQFGSEDGIVNRLITPRVYENLKTVFGQFNAETAIRERSRLNLEVQTAISKAVSGPVMIEGVQIENIDFSDAFENAVEARAQAEVEVARFRQNAEREKVTAEITVTKAKASADAIRAQAQAEADSIRLKGEAEATAINARGAALRDNPKLVDLVQAERWDGKLPTTMIPGSTLPMVDVSKRQ